MRQRALARVLCALAAATFATGCGDDGPLDASIPDDLSAPAPDLAAPDLAFDAAPPPDLSPPPPDLTQLVDFTPEPDLYRPPNPITLWLSFKNNDESDLVLVDDPNPPLF